MLKNFDAFKAKEMKLLINGEVLYKLTISKEKTFIEYAIR